MFESDELETWLCKLPKNKEALFFQQAARYFSSRELSGIVTSISRGASLYEAHKRSGVFSRHIVELNHLIERWEERS